MDDSAYTASDMVKLATVGDIYAAQVLVALLAADDIEATIRSEGLGPYPMSVGRWGEAHVWVDRRDLDLARTIADAPPSDVATTALAGVPDVEHGPDAEDVGHIGSVGKSTHVWRAALWWMVAVALLAWFAFLFWLRLRRII